MTKRNIITASVIALVVSLGVAYISPAPIASAATIVCADGTTKQGPEGDTEARRQAQEKLCANNGGLSQGGANSSSGKTCGGADTSIIECDDDGQNAIFSILSMVIRIMTGAIGLVAVAAVIYGAVLYGTSGDSPENIKKAKEIWTNVVIGLILFAFMVAILEFLVPGGVW